MAIVTGASQRWRLLAAHAGLIALIALTIFPLLAIVSISLRPGNFSSGTLIPDTISLEHWKLALGFSYQAEDGSLVVTLRVCHDWALRSWILGWGPFARVISPATLAADVRADLEAACARYDSPDARELRTHAS